MVFISRSARVHPLVCWPQSCSLAHLELLSSKDAPIAFTQALTRNDKPLLEHSGQIHWNARQCRSPAISIPSAPENCARRNEWTDKNPRNGQRSVSFFCFTAARRDEMAIIACSAFFHRPGTRKRASLSAQVIFCRFHCSGKKALHGVTSGRTWLARRVPG